MHIETISPDQLDRYASIPIAFEVTSIYQVEPIAAGLGGLQLTEVPVHKHYIKDYDALESPFKWKEQFDLSQWGLFIGCDDETPVAGAAVALNAADVNLLEGRKDLAVLWDIRVHPDWRGKGLGRIILRHAADWASRHGCLSMKIETQNVNVPACKFYQAMGCDLGMIHRQGYVAVPAVAHEVMLCWYLKL